MSRTRLAVQRAEDLPNPEDHFGDESGTAISSADAAIAGVHHLYSLSVCEKHAVRSAQALHPYPSCLVYLHALFDIFTVGPALAAVFDEAHSGTFGWSSSCRGHHASLLPLLLILDKHGTCDRPACHCVCGILATVHCIMCTCLLAYLSETANLLSSKEHHCAVSPCHAILDEGEDFMIIITNIV